MTFEQRRNRLTTHFSEGITFVKRRVTVHKRPPLHPSCASWILFVHLTEDSRFSLVLYPLVMFFRLRSLPFSNSSRNFSVFLTSRPPPSAHDPSLSLTYLKESQRNCDITTEGQWRLLCSGTWHVVQWWIITDVLKESAASFISWQVVVFSETSVISILKRLECGRVQFSRNLVTTRKNLKSAFSRPHSSL